VTSSVTHFEIYAEEPPKLAEFYQSLLGWKIEQAPGIDYWRIQSGANTADGLNGGLTYRPFPGPRSWVHYVHVDSLDHMVAEVIRLGGEVLRPKTACQRQPGMQSSPTPRATSSLSGSRTKLRFRPWSLISANTIL
jgi:predicted enzyme related to lactoylglutathione lyase